MKIDLKKIILIFIILIPIVLAFDLTEYPNFFINNRTIDTILVIGDNNIDAPAALNIINGLKLSEYYLGRNFSEAKILNFIYEKPLKRPGDITNLYEKNIIIVGGPCANPIAARIMNEPTTWPECASGFKQDFAKIRLYNNYGKYQLLIAGYDAKDTLAASTAFINFTEYDLKGKEIEVNTYNTENIKFRMIQ